MTWSWSRRILASMSRLNASAEHSFNVDDNLNFEGNFSHCTAAFSRTALLKQISHSAREYVEDQFGLPGFLVEVFALPISKQFKDIFL